MDRDITQTLLFFSHFFVIDNNITENNIDRCLHNANLKINNIDLICATKSDLPINVRRFWQTDCHRANSNWHTVGLPYLILCGDFLTVIEIAAVGAERLVHRVPRCHLSRCDELRCDDVAGPKILETIVKATHPTCASRISRDASLLSIFKRGTWNRSLVMSRTTHLDVADRVFFFSAATYNQTNSASRSSFRVPKIRCQFEFCVFCNCFVFCMFVSKQVGKKKMVEWGLRTRFSCRWRGGSLRM